MKMTYFKPVSTSSRLKTLRASATSAMSAFTKALNDLTAVNDQINKEMADNSKAIQDLVEFGQELSMQKTANQKVIDNIKNKKKIS